ncbi:MAG: tripartite tricarboxylate transporter substrate binding protein [Streptosporangiales bacterium]|nr:tripartite tricarboxylate transporter substrate binding protein [Streptosporangiales bacterium]
MRTTRTLWSVLAAFVLLAGTACGSLGGGGGDGEGAAADPCDKATNYPRGPVQFIIPWAAGGGTDSVGRFIANQLGERLGTQVNVVNRTGGSGAIGHTAISTARPDGQTIGMPTVELTMMHWLGLTQLTYQQFTPIGQVNFDPAGITVRSDAPWKDVEELLAYVEKNPGELTASGTGQGGIWDLARAGMLVEAGLPPDAIRWVPSDGAAPALQELAAGGIDISFASLVENQTLIEEGRVKALGIMAEERAANFPDVPTLEEQGVDYAMSAWRGVAGPEGLPDDIVAELSCHVQKIVNGQAYKSFMAEAGFGVTYRGPEEFGRFLAAEDKSKGDLMRRAGLAK